MGDDLELIKLWGKSHKNWNHAAKGTVTKEDTSAFVHNNLKTNWRILLPLHKNIWLKIHLQNMLGFVNTVTVKVLGESFSNHSGTLCRWLCRTYFILRQTGPKLKLYHLQIWWAWLNRDKPHGAGLLIMIFLERWGEEMFYISAYSLVCILNCHYNPHKHNKGRRNKWWSRL